MPQNPPRFQAVAGRAAAVVQLLDALQQRGEPDAPPGDPFPPSQSRALRAIERSEGISVRALAKVLVTARQTPGGDHRGRVA